MSHFSPREIVSELDRYIIGQTDAKRAVAIALRNRWRRMQLQGDLRDEVVPKNILMVGPTGCGKTEIARRLAKLARAPFVKVEATKFTEIGYAGRDVESIIRDLVEIAIEQATTDSRKDVRIRAEDSAENRVLSALVGDDSSDVTRDMFRRKLRSGELANTEIEINIQEDAKINMPSMDIPGMPGAQMGLMNLGDLLGDGFATRTRKRRLTVAESYEHLIKEEADKLLDMDKVHKTALDRVQQNAIVFIDEIDKICIAEKGRGGGVSREGVQRDLLPLIEGTTVNTRHGNVKTDHILFITSGAFHVSKPSDLLPELQGRLPIRVTLNSLNREDFTAILRETENSLVRQYVALMQTENVTLDFTPDGIEAIAELAFDINESVENIGARRLHTMMERLLEDISFSAPDRSGEAVTIDADFVRNQLSPIAKDDSLSKFIL